MVGLVVQFFYFFGLSIDLLNINFDLVVIINIVVKNVLRVQALITFLYFLGRNELTTFKIDGLCLFNLKDRFNWYRMLHLMGALQLNMKITILIQWSLCLLCLLLDLYFRWKGKPVLLHWCELRIIWLL